MLEVLNCSAFVVFFLFFFMAKLEAPCLHNLLAGLMQALGAHTRLCDAMSAGAVIIELLSTTKQAIRVGIEVAVAAGTFSSGAASNSGDNWSGRLQIALADAGGWVLGP